ncbi:MAG: hypothetical protein GX051_07745 [Clostridiales bacterium]|nr:hypothetical protein [Clostridiales bacterium]
MKSFLKTCAAVMCILTLMSSLLPYAYAKKEEVAAPAVLSSEQRQVLAKTFQTIDFNAPDASMRRAVNSDNPLHIVTFYPGESITSLWSAIPDNEKPYTAILLIPGNTLSQGASLSWLLEQAAICRDTAIPFLIQCISGESFKEWTMPLAFIEETFCPNPYFMGLNCAELYNAEVWRGKADGDMSQYLADAIALMAKYGAYFIWTDTNYFGTDGTILDWIQSNNALYNTMKAHSKNICMMNKESYGDADTYSVMLGLWLAGLIGNWGVSSDWWHWSINGYKTLFGTNDDSCQNEWEQICSYPESMYIESMLFVMSQGGTCFKSEAQYYSVAIQGKRIAGFEYATIPFLDKLIDKTFTIPTREQVLKQTRAAVVGMENYPTFNYDIKESNLYPNTGRFGIIPLLPDNLRLEERAVFTQNNIQLIEKQENERYYKKLFPDFKSDTYAVNTAGQIYWINNCENTDTVKTATVATRMNGAQSVTISAGPHTYVLAKEETAALTFHLGNYRTDKTAMITDMQTADGQATQAAIEKWMTLDANGKPMLDDNALRTTTIIINTDTLPGLVSVTSVAGRVFEHSESFDAGKQQYTITIKHNGAVDLVISTKPGSTVLKYDEKPVADNTKPSVTGADYSSLARLVREYETVDRNVYSPYSYSEFNKAYTMGLMITSENNFTQAQIDAAAATLKEKSQGLVYIGGLRALILSLSTFDFASVTGENGEALSKAYDAALLELLSPTCYYDGKTAQLNVSEDILKLNYDSNYTIKKTAVLLEKYDALRSAAVKAGVELSAEVNSDYPVATRAQAVKRPLSKTAIIIIVVIALAVAAAAVLFLIKRKKHARKAQTPQIPAE